MCLTTHNFTATGAKHTGQAQGRSGRAVKHNSKCGWANNFGGNCNINLVDYRWYLKNVIDSFPPDRLWIQIVELFDDSAKEALLHWLGISRHAASNTTGGVLHHKTKPGKGTLNASPRQGVKLEVCLQTGSSFATS